MTSDPTDHANGQPASRGRIVIGVVSVLLLVGAYVGLSRTGTLDALGDAQLLRAQIRQMGVWGPLVIILLMIAAIVLSPIPSGPIALVAGAAFGPTFGSIYVVVGAEAGAIVAFWIARCLGYDVIRRWTKTGQMFKRLGGDRSQTWLMTIVFASRLIPFISFDAVSYAAGLTPLSFWRFAVATLAGVVPMSVLLAYFGEKLASAQADQLLILVALAGGITVVPIGLKLLWNRYAGKR